MNGWVTPKRTTVLLRPGRSLAPALVALLLTGCSFVSGRPKNALRTVFHISPRAESVNTPEYIRVMDGITGSTLTDSNHVTLLNNGNDYFPSLIRAIDSAKVRVSLESYILRMDKTGSRVVNALVRAAQRGVKVRLLIDQIGSRQIQQKDLLHLVEAGGMARIFNPLKSWTILRVNHRNHRKICVVDGAVAFMGGLNLAKEYDGNGIDGWRDTAIRIEGPAALEAETIFARSWEQGGAGFFGKDLPIVGAAPIKRGLETPVMLLKRSDRVIPRKERPFENTGTARVRAVLSDPTSVSSRILDMYLLAINSAQKRVYITTGYFVPPLTLRRALQAAVKRGVDVRLLLQGETDEPTVRVISLAYYGALLKKGIRIYEWQHPILHAKTMVVDSAWTTIGSANLDGRALFLNYEANFAVADPELGARMEARFLQDLKSSKEVSLEEWEKRPAGQKRNEKLLLPVRGQF